MISYPEYGHSIVSLAATISRYFGVPSELNGLPALENALASHPRHIALLVFDGLGVAQIERYLPEDSFLRTHLADRISSVFPPTTVAAMNSLYSGLSPIQHGWLGWSLYFKEVGRAVDVFPRVDSVTKQKLPASFSPWKILAYESIQARIEDQGDADADPVDVAHIAPAGIAIPGFCGELVSVQDLGHFFDAIARRGRPSVNGGDRAFTMGYWPEPDMSLHKKGGASAEVRALVMDIDARCADLAAKVSDDTLIVVSADHGHADVSSYVDIAAIPGFVECLVMPPFLESRAAMVFVKRERRSSFEEIFRNRLSRHFALFTKDEILARGLLGIESDSHPVHPRADDFIGDYLIVAIADQGLKYYEPEHDHTRDFASHHAGLTSDEMLIPLIVS